MPVVVFSGFEAVKEAAVNHAADFDERPVTPFFEAVGNGSGIAFSSGHIWKQQKKFGVVTLRKLGLGKKGIEHRIHEEAYHLAQAFADAKRQPLDPAIPITNSVTNVICALIFGQRYSLEDEEFLKLKDALNTFVNAFRGTSLRLWLEDGLGRPPQYGDLRVGSTARVRGRGSNRQCATEIALSQNPRSEPISTSENWEGHGSGSCQSLQCDKGLSSPRHRTPPSVIAAKRYADRALAFGIEVSLPLPLVF
ncbi:UNVERIFIED_CONTAM: hypothetical protein K2H54_062232 [Gekko kuhli]